MRQTTLDKSGRSEKSGTVEYRVYEARTILNKYQHVDPWFWNAYSAHPYVGCEHACEYCYARADKYLHTDTPDDFSRIIKVKKNAAELLKKELKKVKKDVIATADYQPAEKQFGLSGKMLEVIRDMEFPVTVIEKSDFVLEDLDVLREIHERTWACVSFSFSGVDENLTSIFEPVAPPPQRRLEAMKTLAEAGIVTGANFMPILPFITDTAEAVEEVVKKVKEYKGTFILIGGLTLDDNVRTRYFKLLREKFPALLPKYEALYASNPHEYYGRISKRVIGICQKYTIRDRIPRFCQTFNQKVAEKLFDKVYRIELEDLQKAWPYRKAAWTVDGLDRDVCEIEDLTTLPGIGKKIAASIQEIMKDL